jgi:hypothetical protein
MSEAIGSVLESRMASIELKRLYATKRGERSRSRAVR